MQAEKIIGVKYVGKIPTVDIEIDSENHIFYGNGIATSNSHGVSYAYLCYYTAYAKAHHTLPFYQVWLNHAHNKMKPFLEVSFIKTSMKLQNIDLLPPSVHYKQKHFFIQDNNIVYGLSQIKNVSEKELDNLFSLIQDSYTTFDYLFKVFPHVNKRSIDSLIDTGSFGYLGVSRNELKHLYTCLSDLTEKERNWIVESGLRDVRVALKGCARTKREGGGASSIRRVPKVLEILKRIDEPGRDLHDIPTYIAQREEFLMGIPLSFSYMDDCLTAEIADTTCKQFTDGKPGKVILAVRIKTVKEHTTKNDQKMAFVTVEDESELDIVCFPDQYDEFQNMLYVGNLVVIFGERSNKGSFVVGRMVEA